MGPVASDGRLVRSTRSEFIAAFMATF